MDELLSLKDLFAKKNYHQIMHKLATPTSIKLVLHLTIDESAFTLLGSLLKILAPDKASLFLPASDCIFRTYNDGTLQIFSLKMHHNHPANYLFHGTPTGLI